MFFLILEMYVFEYSMKCIVCDYYGLCFIVIVFLFLVVVVNNLVFLRVY